MHKGRIEDPSSGITGYLLGADMFLPIGVGAGDMYYKLSPSWTNSANLPLPTSAVQNLYASTLSSSAPKGMPTPTLVSITGAPKNIVASTSVSPSAQSPKAPLAKSVAPKVSSLAASKVIKKSLAPAIAAT
ncbi:MAG: hypothetical protein NTU89_01430, partial [Candidatus Dependentiae bacterium]|nr:hypothetical protein [Candidatus Dependentiae bacterium]